MMAAKTAQANALSFLAVRCRGEPVSFYIKQRGLWTGQHTLRST